MGGNRDRDSPLGQETHQPGTAGHGIQFVRPCRACRVSMPQRAVLRSGLPSWLPIRRPPFCFLFCYDQVNKFISIASKLKKMHNYNTLMAIVSGLNMAVVQRLRKTWAGVKKKRVRKLAALEGTLVPLL